ncbi:putative outer membrane lipoprotein [Luteimonas sp. J16]|jgi:hypothetical protein|uniref:glycine zipper 2TM domain-containing protein n=1 Tax=unclassified Luteimonas TaxID=2629088 RepID=UPI0004AFC020|nr:MULTISPECIES: glycine zipper 2TM domain-containing protein [unclassified Luteimonas]TWG90425.1 putative outer membrane lipoprotein [Luteimonas sp. J16]
MKLQATCLAAALALAMGAASAQDYREYRGPYGDYPHRTAESRGGDWRGSDPQPQYAWARVLRVDPVFDEYARSTRAGRDCEVRRGGYVHRDDPYGGYGGGYGGDDPYARRRDDDGRLVASVLGAVAGAVLGSRIGDGSGQAIGTAVGTVVGSTAGRRIYEANRRPREGVVTVCGPEPYGDRYAGVGDHDPRDVVAYDVTYEYGGREYVTRTDHHPGDRIRVRVDVRAVP